MLSAAPLCWGDQSASVPAGEPSAEALISALNQKVNLGPNARIDLPKGCHFIDADAARVLLEGMKNPVSPSLVGVLYPDDKKWWAVLEFNEVGYVTAEDEKNGDAASILKAVQSRAQSRQEAAKLLSVNWQIEPKYDADAHSLEWAFLAEGKSGNKVVNHTIALFGRRGVLNVTTVRPYRGTEEQADSVSLNDVVARITFKEGQRYADYQTGDKTASGGLKELIVGNEPADAKPEEIAAGGSVPTSVAKGYEIIGGCAALAAGLLVVGRLIKRSARPGAYANGHAVPAWQANGTNGNGRHGSGRQKKVFNYQKFYSDMVLQLSGHSYSWVAPANGHAHRRGASSAPATPVASSAAPNQALANANLELIACQNNLIEEQRNLMREQARIIEEKAKLIKEYNQLMQKWSEDIENQFSLKLD